MIIQIKGISGGVDRRGLATLKYRYLFTGATEDDAMRAALPNTPPLPDTGRQFVEWDVDNTGFIIEVGFEGLLEEPGRDQEQYMIAREWREEPIEAFPKIDRLKEEYGAYEEDGRLKFPEYLEAKGGSSGSGLGGGGSTKQEKNPFFGMTSYPVGQFVATRSYVRRTVPGSVWSDVGNIVQRLPAGFESQPKATWMVDNPIVRKRGNAWEIAEKWKQVDNLKHIEALQLILMKK